MVIATALPYWWWLVMLGAILFYCLGYEQGIDEGKDRLRKQIANGTWPHARRTRRPTASPSKGHVKIVERE